MSTQHEAGAASTHRVLIVGAGYAGMSAAVQLAARVKGRGDVEVTLVNAQERFTERLHMTATGQHLAELSIPRLLEGTGAWFVRGWVTAVDAGAKTVRIDDDRDLRYDTLVYGLGSVADPAVPGVEDYAYTLNSAQDAEALADRLARLGGGTVVVVGSGLTGVESAAEIAERHPQLTVVLLGRREPGVAMSPKARAYLRWPAWESRCEAGSRWRRCCPVRSNWWAAGASRRGSVPKPPYGRPRTALVTTSGPGGRASPRTGRGSARSRGCSSRPRRVATSTP
ncbi:FAD-dependent oxidoreductase [Actinoplanes sp. ATCC 53533]|uniref:FAD-dependent oxidoreductase n=1 Tax=Actinoplanes sp. ATCC 53533 TaxID=1288362 RepID=UPI0018F76558|nr:FAD-dependent oxidoreductase [Actinoplanes sp. ATCC 53533]